MLSDKFQDKVLTEEQTDLVVGGNVSGGESSVSSDMMMSDIDRPKTHITMVASYGKLGN